MKKAILICLSISALALADCQQSLGLCDSYTKALQVDVTATRKERDDLKQSLADTQKELHSAEHPLIPRWAEFAAGFLVGAIGLRLITK